MTHSGGQPHAVGDRGQRYEVSYGEDEEVDCRVPRKVFGWSTTLSGARAMARSINLHPSMFHPHIWDREKQEMAIL